jgi:hypothetical protein
VGDRTLGGRLVTENSWSSQPPIPAGEEQPDHYVLAVLDHIASRPPELAEFLRRHDSGINVVGEFRRMNGGFHMSPELVARCADLGVWLDFDLYNFVARMSQRRDVRRGVRRCLGYHASVAVHSTESTSTPHHARDAILLEMPASP